MSVHRLIVGQSMSGKSNLAKYIAGLFHSGGGRVLIFDPLQSGGWPSGENVEKYSKPEVFLNAVAQARESAVFIDEAKVLWDHDVKAADRILYQYRHHGLQVHLIAQRAKMIRPNARDQCATLYAFKQSREDADILAGNYGDETRVVTGLAKGEFLVSDGYSCHRYVLDYSKGFPPRPKVVNKG